DCATLEPGRDPVTDLDVLLHELAAYSADLVTGGEVPLTERPAVVVLNKVDVPEARELAELVRPDLQARGLRVFEVSAASHEGLRPLTFALAALVAEARAATPVAPERVVLRPTPVDERTFTVTRHEERDRTWFAVRGRKPERWVHQTDFANDEAVGYLADRLARLGVEEELFAAGATPGAEVVIGDGPDAVVFDWEPTLMTGAELLGARGTDLRLD
ncbi:MAG TPA: Obg family GTPase CgtA, partial [Actinotalea sp.]|nr:Obg family GTPase CgtA [Actinotalea sp.]